MNAIPLARLLVEFSPDGDTASARTAGARAKALATSSEQEIAARLEEALARGREEGRAAAEADVQARLDAEREAFELRLKAERQAWAEAEGQALAARLHATVRDMESRIAETAARILHPFLKEELCRRAANELAALVGTFIAKEPDARLAISGPEDLIEALRGRLADTAPGATFSVGEGPDVRVTLDQAVVETRLEAWLARIREAVA